MADLVSYALTDVASVKESLGISSGDTSKDNIIKRKINLATDAIEIYCNLPEDHHFKQATYTDELYDGSGSDSLLLRMRPVTQVGSISRRNAYENTDSWDAIDTQDYFTDLSSGLVEGLAYHNERYNSFKVTYTAGYSTIPTALQEACVALASYYVSNDPTSGTNVKSKSEGARKIEYFEGSNPADANAGLIDELNLSSILSRYVLINVG